MDEQLTTCPKCGNKFAVSAGRLIVLRGETGYLFIAGPETPVHRCSTLTPAEAAELLSTYRDVIDNPPIE